MPIYIHQQKGWPRFKWEQEKLSSLLATVHYNHGRLLERMSHLGFQLQEEAALQTLTLDVLKSSEIEGEILNPDQVRSSIAKRLGIEIGGLVQADRNVEGIVEMMLDATQNYTDELTSERLFGWHAALFPTGRTGMQKIVVGAWRNNEPDDPMQVVSGAMGKETVHFEAPGAELLDDEMRAFTNWFKSENKMNPFIKAAIAHFWFVTIHPFDDGNGRIARTITDLQLSHADNSRQRFYSMSAQIRRERNAYYEILEKTQKGTLNITDWLKWFLECINRSLSATNETLEAVFKKAAFWGKHALLPINNRQKLILNKLLDGFTGKLTSSKWAKIAKCSSDTAIRDINQLLAQEILVKEPAGGRSTNYLLV